MGIKDLYKYLNVKHPECFQLVHFSQFAYKKIAIDMLNLLYIYKARDEKYWMKNILLFLLKLKKWCIHPICIFDGPVHPLKKKTIEKRKFDREKGRKRTDELRKSLDHYIETNEINQNLQCLIENRNELVSKINNQILITQVKEFIDKQYKNYNIYFNTYELDIIKKLISALGINVITAPSDGEAYCSFLSVQNKVDLVISNDSDVFFFGCKKVICKFTEDGGYLLEMDDILNKLDITYNELIDICILCGTDYNICSRGIGFIRALNLVKKYKKIDHIVEDNIIMDVKNLLVNTEILEVNWTHTVNEKKLFELFHLYNIDLDINMCMCYNDNILFDIS